MLLFEKLQSALRDLEEKVTDNHCHVLGESRLMKPDVSDQRLRMTPTSKAAPGN